MPARRPRTSASDRVSGLAFGDAEVELLRGPSDASASAAPGTTTSPSTQPQPAEPSQRPPRAPTRRQRTKPPTNVGVGAERIRAEVYLPDQVVSHAKALVRPSRTGARRTLSVAFALQAYIRAIDHLDLSIDFSGLDRDDDDQAVQRVLHALDRWRGHPA